MAERASQEGAPHEVSVTCSVVRQIRLSAMPNIWHHTTPLSLLLAPARPSKDLLDFNRDPTKRPCCLSPRGQPTRGRRTLSPLNEKTESPRGSPPLIAKRRALKTSRPGQGQLLDHSSMCLYEYGSSGERVAPISPLRVSDASARPRTLTPGPSRLRSGCRRTTFTWTGRENLTRDGDRAGGPEDRRDARAAACATGEGATRATCRSIRRLCRPGACADTQDSMRNAKTQCAAADRQHCGVSKLRCALGPPPSCPNTGVQSYRNPPHAVCFSGDRQVRGHTRDARASKEQSAPAVTRQSAATRGRPSASTARMICMHEPSVVGAARAFRVRLLSSDVFKRRLRYKV